MAYTPKQWVCGETITADGLNNIEEGVQEALECCGDKGFECTESQVTVFEGSLTTTSMGSFSGTTFTPTEPIEGDSITVTFNGTEYELPKVYHGYGELNDGAPSYATYPCFVAIEPGSDNMFFTPSAGTYSVKLSVEAEIVETSECFEKAVKSVGSELKYVKDDSSDNGGVIENLVGNNIPSASRNQATGAFSHAEGGGIESDYGQTVYLHTIASGTGSHAEGNTTVASGNYSHAEGSHTTASGYFAHAEGDGATASGRGSHAEGLYAVASGEYSHAEGLYTEALGRGQHVLGKYNIVSSSFAEIVGNGSNGENRSNARTLDWNGNEALQGSLTLGKGTADETTITATQLQALLALL